MTIHAAHGQQGSLVDAMRQVDGLALYAHITTVRDKTVVPSIVNLGQVEEFRPVYNQLALLVIAGGLSRLVDPRDTRWHPGFYAMRGDLTWQELMALAAGGGDCPDSQAVAANVCYGRVPMGLNTLSGMTAAGQALGVIGSLCYGGWQPMKLVDASHTRSMVLRVRDGMKLFKKAGTTFESGRVKAFLELIESAKGLFLASAADEVTFTS